jgi:chaperonin GroES
MDHSQEGDLRIMAKSKSLRPLHDRVLIKRLEEQDEKHGSIIIPDSAKEKPQEGKVVAVGTGRVAEDGKILPLAVKAGDHILFGKYSGSEVKISGEEYLILREEDILGVVDWAPDGVLKSDHDARSGVAGRTKPSEA